MPIATVAKPELMPWKDEYSVKIKHIDDQHKGLVKLVNELHVAMLSGHAKDSLASILSQLISYTRAHFITEEVLLQAQGYPELAAHKAEHESLTAKVLQFQKEFVAGKAMLSMEILEFLKNWLKNHIMGTDKRYSPFMNAKGVR